MTARRLVRIGSAAVCGALVTVVAGSAAAECRTGQARCWPDLETPTPRGSAPASTTRAQVTASARPEAYPVLESQRIGAALSFVACSGATTGDVESSQLECAQRLRRRT